jgi:hypothetical protein
MTDEVKALLKEINGKLVIYTGNEAYPEARVECIILADPKVGIISIKPYGHEVKDLKKYLISKGWDWTTVAELEKKNFCFSTHNVEQAIFRGLEAEAISMIRRIIAIPPNGDYIFNDVRVKSLGAGISPSCPY